MASYNLSILDFKAHYYKHIQKHYALIIYPYWILKVSVLVIDESTMILIIYPYWILNGICRGRDTGDDHLIIYPYWILKKVFAIASIT